MVSACVAAFFVGLLILLLLDNHQAGGSVLLQRLPAGPRRPSWTSRKSPVHAHRALGATTVPQELQEEIRKVAEELWGDELRTVLIPKEEVLTVPSSAHQSGEARLPPNLTFDERAKWFEQEARRGDAPAQHSLALLLWSGFCVPQNDVASAQWHAAAASQRHLDGMAVLGGCLRTGTGCHRDETLGLKLIEFCAKQWNPTGVNKKAALLETNDNWSGAVNLYVECLANGKTNALLLLNLGYCQVHGLGIPKKNPDHGIELWQTAASMAPDQGSEEAAWFLYQEYQQDDPKEATKWLHLAADLGYDNAVALVKAMDY